MHSRLSSRSGRCALRGSLREEAACRRVAEPGHPTARRPQIRTSACLGVYRRCFRVHRLCFRVHRLCFRMHDACFRVHGPVLNSVQLGASRCTRRASGCTTLYSIQYTSVLPGACGLLPEAPRCTQFSTPGCFRVHDVCFRVHRGCFRVHRACFRVHRPCFPVYDSSIRMYAASLPRHRA